MHTQRILHFACEIRLKTRHAQKMPQNVCRFVKTEAAWAIDSGRHGKTYAKKSPKHRPGRKTLQAWAADLANQAACAEGFPNRETRRLRNGSREGHDSNI